VGVLKINLIVSQRVVVQTGTHSRRQKRSSAAVVSWLYVSLCC